MAMRLQELHPSLVHFPLALLPLSIGADLLGRLTGSDALRTLGRQTMPLAAAAGAVAAVAGLVAQEEVKATGAAHDLLVTHRNLNALLVVTTTLLAGRRATEEEPGAGYLALGLAGIGLMAYTASLGGAMVYGHGLGVEAAGGVRAGRGPEITPATAGPVAREAIADVREGAEHALEHLREGDFAPALTGGSAHVSRDGDSDGGDGTAPRS